MILKMHDFCYNMLCFNEMYAPLNRMNAFESICIIREYLGKFVCVSEVFITPINRPNCIKHDPAYIQRERR